NPWPGVQSSSSLAQTSRDWTEWGDVHLPGSYRHRYSWRLSPTKQLVDRALSRRRLQNLVSSYPTRTVSGRRRNCQSTGGLRPARLGGIRVELDSTDSRIVHCYGHGGNGVALAWGTASEAVKLGLESLRRGG
ncbi:hypothetical protein BOX15_Mlig028495g1, partial [Macrostomum lignano]